MFGRTKLLWTGSSLQACGEFSKKTGDVPLPHPGFYLPDKSGTLDRVPAMRYALPVWSVRQDATSDPV